MTYETPSKKYVQTTAKAKLHKQQFGAIIYFIVITAIGLSLTMLATSGRLAEDGTGPVTVFGFFYGTAMIAMIWIMVYMGQNRAATLEAIESGTFCGDRIRFSQRGDTTHRVLRFGLCLFAVMSVGYCAAHCYHLTVDKAVTPGNVILHTFRIVFLITQALFILFFHKLIILTDSRLFKYLVMHLVAVNLTTVVHMMAVNLLMYRNADDHEYKSEWTFTVSSVLNYLHPAIAEFSVIAVVILFELADSTGHMDKVKPRTNPVGMFKRKDSYIWKILGIVILTCTVVFMLALEIIGKRLNTTRYILHITEIGAFTILALVLCGFAVTLVRRLKFTVSYSKRRVEEKLLLATAGLSIIYFVACIFLSVGYIFKESAKSLQVVQLLRCQIGMSILQLIHVVLQTYLLQDNFYRCCQDAEVFATRPGRPFLILLNYINLSLWVIHSFQITNNDQLHTFSNDNSIMEQMGGVYNIVQFTMPLVTLFYFISSVCLQIACKWAYMHEGARYDRCQDWSNVSRNVCSELPYLDAHSKPFVNDQNGENYEKRGDAFFNDLPSRTSIRSSSEERSVKRSTSNGVEEVTNSKSAVHQEKTCGLKGDHKSNKGKHDDNGSNIRESFKEIMDMHEPSVGYDNEFDWEHPEIVQRQPSDFEDEGYNFHNAGMSVQINVMGDEHGGEKSEQVAGRNTFSNVFNDHVFPPEEELVFNKDDNVNNFRNAEIMDVHTPFDDNEESIIPNEDFKKTMDEIKHIQEDVPTVEGNDEFNWKEGGFNVDNAGKSVQANVANIHDGQPGHENTANQQMGSDLNPG